MQRIGCGAAADGYTVIDSDMAFSLRNPGVPQAEIARRVEEARTLMMQARYLLLDEPTAGLDPGSRAQMIALNRRIAAQGNHVVISRHDIDLIYEVCEAVYVLHHGEPGEVFIRRALIEQAGLTQPWLVKLHCGLGWPLCKSKDEFLARMRAMPVKEAS